MHYITDQTPVEKPPEQKKWMMEHEENLSATPDEYVPYSTTRTKIESWTPPQNRQSFHVYGLKNRTFHVNVHRAIVPDDGCLLN